jgi:hypothetical protein
MEVRGGCGYIEEWSDPRLVRDAHLGSIWEGTSNIVALDVVRAMRREDSLSALQAHLRGLLAEVALDAADATAFEAVLGRVSRLAEQAAAEGGVAITRQAASALYHLTSAVAMAWEARRADQPRRLALARAVLTHRLLPRDPLQAGDVVDPAEALYL